MVDVQRTFTVRTPIETAVSYLRDFTHTTQWDPGTKSCEQIAVGPVAVGTEWRNVSGFFGTQTELTYRLTRDDPNRLVFEGKNKTATSVDDMTFEKIDDNSTQVTYRAHVKFDGLARLIDPLARLGFEYLAEKTRKQMTRTLEAL